MIVYVESNFILELALEQEQVSSCEAILSICELGKARLVIPGFCIGEPYETLGRRAYYDCKMLFRFDSGLGYLQSHLSS